jgi:DNA-binding phage protein
MDKEEAELHNSLDSEEAIAMYLRGAAKLNDESYLRHCQATAARAHAHLLEAKETQQ